MLVPLDPETYAARAERFVTDLDREYYLHFAGHKERFEIEEIYERNANLFEREIVDRLKEALDGARSDDDRRRLRFLLQLAVEGLIGQATKAETAALAEREGSLEIEVDGSSEPYRQAAITQANEPDSERRALIETARMSALDAELNPLYVAVTERAHALAVELGWGSYRAMYEELKAIDLDALEQQTVAFIETTGAFYRDQVAPEIERQTGIAFDHLRRSDLPYFFRARTYDGLFPEERLMEAFEHTLAGLGIDLRAQPNVSLDLEQRPRKSPRAFCAPVRVPEEVYLVIPRRGGHDDYAALFHEGGHTEHYANVDPALPFEFRHLGDNSVTEGFAFLLEHVTEDPAWLRAVLGADDAGEYLAYTRASKLIFLRRYAAKLSYELELHAGRRPLAEMPGLYTSRLSDAVGVEWPGVSYLADVDEGYYAANYLRAWAFEAQLRRALRQRYGEEWFSHAEAGELLRSLWREGQRRGPEELLGEVAGEELDFAVMVEEVKIPDFP
jgi:hypothetical protein